MRKSRRRIGSEAKLSELPRFLEQREVLVSEVVLDRRTFQNSRVTVDRAKLESLAEDIRRRGLMNLPLVKDAPEGLSEGKRYRLRTGFRRFEAVTAILGWDRIRVNLLPEGADEADEYWINLSENLHREELSTFEIAARISEMESKFGVTAQQFGQQFGMSPSTVYTLMRYYRNLPPEILEVWKTKHPLLTMRVLERLAQLPHIEAVNHWLEYSGQKVITAASVAATTARTLRGGRDTPAFRKQRTIARMNRLFALRHHMETWKGSAQVVTALRQVLDFALGDRATVPIVGFEKYKHTNNKISFDTDPEKETTDAVPNE